MTIVQPTAEQEPNDKVARQPLGTTGFLISLFSASLDTEICLHFISCFSLEQTTMMRVSTPLHMSMNE